MITVSIDKQNITAVKDFFEGAIAPLRDHAQKKLANIAYHSSFAANILTYATGSFFNPLALLSTAVTVASVKAVEAVAKGGDLSDTDKKSINVAKGNLVINVASSMIGMPLLNALLTGYNFLAEYIEVKVE